MDARNDDDVMTGREILNCVFEKSSESLNLKLSKSGRMKLTRGEHFPARAAVEAAGGFVEKEDLWHGHKC